MRPVVIQHRRNKAPMLAQADSSDDGTCTEQLLPCFGALPLPLVTHPASSNPCLRTLGHTAPAAPQWAHEIQHDWFRFVCPREGDRVRVFSRRPMTGPIGCRRSPRRCERSGSSPSPSTARRSERSARDCLSNGIDPQAWLTATLDRIAAGWPNNNRCPSGPGTNTAPERLRLGASG
jgi:hypothetical protein